MQVSTYNENNLDPRASYAQHKFLSVPSFFTKFLEMRPFGQKVPAVP